MKIKKFSLISRSCCLVEELNESFSTINYIQKKLKTQGIDTQCIEHCCRHLNKHLSGKNTRQCSLSSLVERYLRKQAGKLEQGDKNVNISTNIIESMFSIYKRRKSPNHLCGVTLSVLLLPLMTKCKQEWMENINIKKMYERGFSS